MHFTYISNQILRSPGFSCRVKADPDPGVAHPDQQVDEAKWLYHNVFENSQPGTPIG
jgi:hypothetical protein